MDYKKIQSLQSKLKLLDVPARCACVRQWILTKHITQEEYVAIMVWWLANHDGHEALDNIFEKIDDLLLDGQFTQCDIFIGTIPIDLLRNVELLTILTILGPAADKLPSYDSFFLRTKSLLEARGADSDSLLYGFRTNNKDIHEAQHTT